MPWFKIDDASHSHPKFVAAGNAAIGLFVRCGAYSAQHLTEGIVPGVIASLYGTTPQARKLVKVGLWHEAGHDCPRCPQPRPGDYVVHDFFEGGRNATRAQVEASRKGAAERAAKSREARKRPANADESKNIHDAIGDDSSANQDRNEPHFSDSAAGQDGLSQRTGLPGVTPAQATSTPYQVPPTEVPPPPPPSADKPGTELAPTSGRGEIQPLIDAMGHRGMHVTWTFSGSEWVDLRDAVRRVGVDTLVDYAARSWQAARDKPHSARYFIRGWIGLQAPTHTGPLAGPPSQAQTYLAQMQSIAAELAAVEGGTP
jgi:hypothetical protein